jgi:hypothetical protein
MLITLTPYLMDAQSITNCLLISFQMFGTVDAGEEVVVQGSPIIPREVRQVSAPPAISAGEKADPQKGMECRIIRFNAVFSLE